LSSEEVESACRDRGMKVSGLHEFQLRRNLEQWLDLSLNHKLPPSLLLLSRTFTMSEKYVLKIKRVKSFNKNLPFVPCGDSKITCTIEV